MTHLCQQTAVCNRLAFVVFHPLTDHEMLEFLILNGRYGAFHYFQCWWYNTWPEFQILKQNWVNVIPVSKKPRFQKFANNLVFPCWCPDMSSAYIFSFYGHLLQLQHSHEVQSFSTCSPKKSVLEKYYKHLMYSIVNTAGTGRRSYTFVWWQHNVVL